MRDLRRNRNRQGRPNHVSVEGLEGRTLLSTYTVTNVNDSGSGSLRQAITDANKHSGADTIRFAIGSGAKTITPRSALPGIMGETVLDATTQPGYAGRPLIEINGSSTGGASVPGFIVYAGNSTIRGFVINRFSGNGIMLMKLGGNVIAGNYIGTNSSGTAASPNVAHGILVQSPGNRIGGITASDRNVLSGNGKSGVFLYTATSNRTLVVGNYIGTNASGTAAVGNGGDGVQVHASHTNTIGGTTPGARNVISGNKQDGILIASYGAAGNVVQGNYVGTNAAGTDKIPNALYGVEVSQYNNTIGGTTAGARNVISGNTKSGVALYKDSSYGNKVVGNYIGTDYTGTRDLGNTGRGVDFTTGAKNNFLGGTTAAERNVISGNDTGGIGVFNGSAFNLIQGNYVGTNAAGTGPLGNGGAGVSVSNSGPNTIGGTAPGAGNVISANNQGIALAAGTGPVTIQANRIGTDANGTRDFGNLTDGIYVGASGALIGGSTSAACNIISGNNGDGIRVYRASGVRIERNCIGVGASILTALGNAKCGVVLIGASGNTIRYNTVANNGDKGIYVMMGADNLISLNKLL